MEPLAHTMVGASLGHLASSPPEAERRETGLVLAGIVAANVPDVDALAYFAGSDFALGFRRGITHGVLGMAIWPIVLAAVATAWRRRRDPASKGLSPRLLAVVALGCWSHPLLDWLNNYGIRLLMPFEPTWFYGDTVFIVDPWMWLVLGGGLVLGRAPGSREMRRWGVLAAICAVAVALTPTPIWARGAWLGVLGVVAFRAVAFRGSDLRVRALGAGTRTARRRPTQRRPADRSTVQPGVGAEIQRPGPWSRAPVGLALALFGLYVGSLAAVERVSRSRVIDALELERVGARDLLVGPMPMDPLAWQVVARVEGGYVTGSYRWRGGLVDREHVESEEAEPGVSPSEVEAAWSAPEVDGFATWVRFPFHREVVEPEGRFVYLLDARYASEPTTVFGGVRVPANAAPPEP